MSSRFLLLIVAVLVHPGCGSGTTGSKTAAGSGGVFSSAGAASGGASGGTGRLGVPSGGVAGAGETSSTGGGGSPCTPCPLTCCDAGASCVDDGSGNLSCKKDCSTNSACPSVNPCCVLLKNGAGVCGGSSSDVLCRCTTGAECSSKACAPNTDADGNPVGPCVCVPNDGAPYHGCAGVLTSCASGCCFTDKKDNQFCAAECLNDSQCGAASCNAYSNANTTCGGMLGCGPQ